jgi:hypothetical protein
MGKVASFGLAVLPVLVAIWIAQVVPNPVAMLKK